MYGKIFDTMFRGSMVGSGAPVFAVWSYVIANMQPDKVVGAQVDLNPNLLAFILGEDEAVVLEAIKVLCAPDKKSTSKSEDGKRLIQLGQFSYRVVNGPHYMNIRTADERREYFRNKKREQRMKIKSRGMDGEAEYERANRNEDRGAMARIMHEHTTKDMDKLKEISERQAKERQEKEDQIAMEAKNAELLAKREDLNRIAQLAKEEPEPEFESGPGES